MDLKSLAAALDAASAAIAAILAGNRVRATRRLQAAAAAAEHAFPVASRESYALTIMLGAITEAAGGTP